MSAAFWEKWADWRHGEPGTGTFADVMVVLRLHEHFAAFVAAQVDAPVDVVDLGCGGGQLAPALAGVMRDRIRSWLGVDAADPAGMPARVARSLTTAGLEGRYLHHDLADGLPDDLPDQPLVVSCWGLTYVGAEGVRRVLRQLRARGGGVLCLSMLTVGRFDREVLTARFKREVVPRQLWAAVRGFDATPARQLQLAIRALPTMRQFGDELAAEVELLPVETLLDVLRSEGLEPTAIDTTGLWGQTTNLCVRIARG